MGLLQKAKQQNAFAKIGMLGFPGSGKSYTAHLLAIGLAKTFGKGKPVAFFDTEGGSDWLVKKFAAAGVELFTVKQRSLEGLCQTMTEAESMCSVLIIDSISHVWVEFMDAYRAKKKIPAAAKMPFHHYAEIKSEWRQKFTDRFLTSNLHIIMCGRAGYEYEYEEQKDGTKELLKTGVKMKAETELGHEPSILLGMELVRESDGDGASIQAPKSIHRCHILKDRSDTLKGSSIDDPTFDSFAPIWKEIAPDGEYFAVDTTKNSEGMFASPDRSWGETNKRREILMEEMKGNFDAMMPGTGPRERAIKANMCEVAMGTTSARAMESMPLDDLAGGVANLRHLLNLVSDSEFVIPETPKEMKAIFAAELSKKREASPIAAVEEIAEKEAAAEEFAL